MRLIKIDNLKHYLKNAIKNEKQGTPYKNPSPPLLQSQFKVWMASATFSPKNQLQSCSVTFHIFFLSKRSIICQIFCFWHSFSKRDRHISCSCWNKSDAKKYINKCALFTYFYYCISFWVLFGFLAPNSRKDLVNCNVSWLQ